MRRIGSLFALCARPVCGVAFVRQLGFVEQMLGVALGTLAPLSLTLASLLLAVFGGYVVCRTCLRTTRRPTPLARFNEHPDRVKFPVSRNR